ncbi:hypothetical protein [Rummeliibacillus stabekisii]|uniref:Uncharacterized protein n=1 Tax=Rummeliibacillus stabekisii TaxID=241244 RepID=A0A143HF52_9BACL|nr:hypothetical protein [Rummeliibacillus stabekisii]AMX00363.1 hypothetical protein ATY39_13645 [Rummeliibacillus stabekisii]
MGKLFYSKTERAYIIFYQFALMTLLILISAELSLDYFNFGFILYATTSYIIMYAGAIIYQKMYISTYMAVKSIGHKGVPIVLKYFMMILILIVSIVTGFIMFFYGRNLYASMYVPAFFFIGALIWDTCVNQMIEIIEERDKRDIKFIINHKS